MTELNSRQRDAIEHGDGPLMVLAGAGTGKTRVLVHRIARLVERGVPPWEILAVTFTNKAADEMRHRLHGVLGDAAEAMWIGTFHAICARILRRWGPQIGLERGFAIFDESDQVKIIERISRAVGIDEGISARAIAARIDRAKNRGLDPTDPTGHLDDAVARVYPAYQDKLTQEMAVDFNDLIGKTLLLLDAEPAASALRTKFQHVLVDEFQDTNRVQYQLIWRLAEVTRNLTVVGDDDQSIYAWRGAEPKNLLDFDVDFPDARVVKLEQNYRSTQTILDAANRVIAKNLARHDKSLWTEQGTGHPVLAFRSFDDRGEAGFVAAAVVKLVTSGGAKPSDVAVLYRTNAQSRVIEEQLRAARVPVRIAGGASFFDRKEVKDLVAYLRLLVNPGADTAFDRVINVPARGLGEKTVERVRGIAFMQETPMLEAARFAAAGGAGASGIGPTQRVKLREFAEMIDQLRALVAAGTSVAELIVHVIERSGLRAKLEADADAESTERIENLAELVTMAVDFRDEVEARLRAMEKAATKAKTRAPATDAAGAGAAGEPQSDAAPGDLDASLPTFLERIALSSGEDDIPGTGREQSADGVVLTTIHVAKGLEWPVVFLTGMEDGLFPSLRPRDDTSEESAMEEERRLAYVAITRARERLILSFARTRRVWGEIRLQDPSRFIADATGGQPIIDVD